MTEARRAELVKARALALGFDQAGVTHLDPVHHAPALDRWLAQGMAGTMTYMHRQAARRKEPSKIRPGATCAVMLLKNYHTPDRSGPVGHGQVAKYARGRDYHESLAGPLEELAEYVRSLGEADAFASPFVDAGPVPERELAQRAGLGWIAKNTMLITPGLGSFTFIASVFTNVAMSADTPFEADRCGSCRLCLDACPTDAFPEARTLDARRCISYLTIEYRGAVDADLVPQIGDWVFGCDVCQDVCPWNEKFARDTTAEMGLTSDRQWLPLTDFTEMSDESFDAEWGWTPFARSGLEGMQRNIRHVTQNRSEACPEP